MFRLFIESFISDLQKSNANIDLWSKEYLFDKKYAEHRNKFEMYGGPEGHRSRLSLLLREGLTSERRALVFNGDYDLGNGRAISPELCTYEELTNHLYGKGRNGIAANDAYETIQDGTYRITGKKMKEHFQINSSTALKVIKTLWVMSSQRQARLMQLLIIPALDEQFSLSLREAYPYHKSQDHVWLIADLKAYLSVELNEDRIFKISATFSHLLERTNTLDQKIGGELTELYKTVDHLINAYLRLIDIAEEFSFQNKLENIPLDEEYFIHLHVLEFAHFAIGFPQLARESIPEFSINEVFSEMRALAKNVFSASRELESDLLISLQDVPDFSIEWQDEIIEIMSKAMGERIDSRDYKKCIADTVHLLTHFYLFQEGQFIKVVTEEKMTCIWHVISALCCVWHAKQFPANLKPYWLGQPSQGGSINATMKASIFDNLGDIDNVPEEHRHFLSNRLGWFAGSLCGYGDLVAVRMKFKSALLGKMLAIIRTNNIDSIQRELSNFFDRLEKCAK